MLKKEINHLKQAEKEQDKKTEEPLKIFDIDTKKIKMIVAEAKQIVGNTIAKEKDIDSLIEKREKDIQRIKNIDKIKDDRIKKVENYNPFFELSYTDNYDQLADEGLIDRSQLAVLKDLDAAITQLESIKFPTAEQVDILERLRMTKKNEGEKIDNFIMELQQETRKRQEELKNKIFENYSKRINKITSEIKEIESNPDVLNRLYDMAKKEMEEYEKKIEEEATDLVKESYRCLQSVEAKNKRAIQRIKDILGEQETENLKESIDAEKREKQSIFDHSRSELIKSILEGEGDAQLKSPREIVPWVSGKSSSVNYFDALYFLMNNSVKENLRKIAQKEGENSQKAKEILERTEKAYNDYQMLRELIPPKWKKKKDDGKKEMTKFWAAFEERIENDEKGITELKKKEREEREKRKKERAEALRRIIEKGGIIAKMPVVEKTKRGKLRVIGYKNIGILLEERISSKGNHYLAIKEITEGAENWLDRDNLPVSPMNGKSFPRWIYEAVKENYPVDRNGNFVLGEK